jgi:mannose-6-phosphate isomerase-like protein (cupin superfamily)
MITLYEFENFIHKDLVYEQKIISIINNDEQQICVNSLKELYDFMPCTIKLEQMEKYNEKIFNYCQFLAKKYCHQGPITCHIFKSLKDSKSFGLHTDPDDVIIFCVDGIKNIIVDNIKHKLKPQDFLFIPANTPHKVINEEDSLVLSFGLEKFYIEKINHELDVLPQNN